MAAHWDYDRAQPIVAPGSLEEATALEAIDEARDAELEELHDTPAERARRRERYWRRHR